jgi:hypothetical protein
MSIKSRVVADDGLTVVEQIDQDTDFSGATPEERARWLPPGFERMVQDAEQYWRAHDPPDVATSTPLTRPWYAERILPAIDRLRAAIARDASLERIVLDALRVGQLTEAAVWRFNHGKSARVGIKRRQRKRVAGLRSGETRRARNRPNIEVLAKKIRDTQPYSQSEYPTTLLAQNIGRKLRLPVETVRSALKTLKIK